VQDLKKGDLVYAEPSKFGFVREVRKTEKADLVVLKFLCSPLVLVPEETKCEVWFGESCSYVGGSDYGVCRPNRKNKVCQNCKRMMQKFSSERYSVPAEMLEKEVSFSIFPKPRLPKFKFDFHLPLTSDLGYIIGYFCGDGGRVEWPNHVGFFFDSKVAEKKISLFKSLLSRVATNVRIRKHKRETTVVTSDKNLVSVLSTCVDGMKVKKLPLSWLMGPREFSCGIKRGLLASNGHLSYKRELFDSSSTKLTMFWLLHHLNSGVLPSFRVWYQSKRSTKELENFNVRNSKPMFSSLVYASSNSRWWKLSSNFFSPLIKRERVVRKTISIDLTSNSIYAGYLRLLAS